MASKADTWMPFYVADYLKDTMHLSRDQHGGYLLLLMACWNGAGRIPNDDAQLACLAKATPAEWRKMAPILRRFFTVDGDELVQGRVVQEYEKAQRLSEIRRENGGKGGRPRKQNETEEKATGLANGKLTETPSPSPIVKEANASSTTQDANASFVRQKPDDGFEIAWKAYPALGRSRSKSQAKTKPIWREASKAAGGEDRLVAAVRRYVAEDTTHKGECGPPAFDRWLRDGRWEHWLPGGTGGDQETTAPASTFDGPPALRAALVRERDEDYARRWLDHYCRWRSEDRTLLARTAGVAATLERDLSGWLAKHDLRVAVDAANSNRAELAERESAA